MKCPFCSCPESKVIDSRPVEENNSIRRRRECLECHQRFTTYEIVDVFLPVVIKKDGSKEIFDKNKLLSGLLKACEKRPVNAEAVAEHIRTHVYDGAVILMHDLYESTVDAMAIIIPELKALGYELVTISELAEVKGYTLEEGKAYTDFTLIESEESSNGQ